MDRERRGTFVIGVALLVAAFLLLTRCGGDGGTTKVGAVPNDQGAAQRAPVTATAVTPDRDDDADDADDTDRATRSTPTRSPARTRAPAPTDPVPADPAPAVAGPGSLSVDGEPLLPLSAADRVGRDGDLSLLSGGRAVARGVQVLSVPADEGFWVGTGPRNRVWVQLVGPPPESPYTVLPGDTTSFSAVVTPNGSGFARRVGVTAAEGATTLIGQRQHLQVSKRDLTLYHRP